MSAITFRQLEIVPEQRVRRGRPSGLGLDPDCLRHARARLGYTQADLAELAGVTTRTVQNAERGLRVAPSVARDLARALRVSISSLSALDPCAVQRALREAGYAALPPHAARVEESSRVAAAIGGGDAFVILGLSAADNTQHARTLADRAGSRFRDGVVWVSARPGIASVAQQAEIARALGFDDRLPAAAHVADEAYALAFRLAFWSRRRLLILDGVDDLASLTAFVGARGEHAITTLVTTTSPEIAAALGAAGFTLTEPGPPRACAAERRAAA